MTTLVAFILGILIGGLIMYFNSRGKEREISLLKASSEEALKQLRASSEETVKQMRLSHEEALKQQRSLLEERIKDHELSEHKLKDQFSLLATEVLNKNLEAQIKALKSENTHDLDRKKQEFTQSFEEIKSHLKSTGEKIQLFEKERVDQYAKIQQQIETMSHQEQKLIQETERLKSALTTSQSVRGRWGELVLRNILTQSDMVSGIDFEEQSSTSGSEGNLLKPDFLIKLPQSGHLVIDSKASIFDSYLESEAVQSETDRQSLHQDFVRRLRTRITELSGKEYQKFVTQSLPYVILFVPSEAAIRAAFDVDSNLFQWSVERKVFIASPATILPLIMLIAHSRQQYKLSEKAHELSKVVEQIGDRLDLFVKRLTKVHSGLDQATRAWNEAIDKSWYGNQSIQKSIEKAKELGGNIELAVSLTPLENAMRAIEQSEEQVDPTAS